jgi:hypothetical protein
MAARGAFGSLPSNSSFSDHHFAQFYVAAFAGPTAEPVIEPAGCLVSVQSLEEAFTCLCASFCVRARPSFRPGISGRVDHIGCLLVAVPWAIELLNGCRLRRCIIG